jgi:hypothetical protein
MRLWATGRGVTTAFNPGQWWRSSSHPVSEHTVYLTIKVTVRVSLSKQVLPAVSADGLLDVWAEYQGDE